MSDFRPGDLCKYMSRTVLILSHPFRCDWATTAQGESADDGSMWIEAIEIDDNTFRKIDCEALTLIQRAKEK